MECCDEDTRPGRRVIFLDVDGVLHPMGPTGIAAGCSMHEAIARAEEEAERSEDSIWKYPICPGEFCEENMNALRTIVEATAAEIVLSSTWREAAYSTAAVAAKMAEHGLPPLVGSTPQLPYHPLRPMARRGDECIAWLLSQPHPITSFVVIDDSELTLGSSELDASHFVQTNTSIGLTVDNALEAIRILGVALPAAVPLRDYLRPVRASSRDTSSEPAID